VLRDPLIRTTHVHHNAIEIDDRPHRVDPASSPGGYLPQHLSDYVADWEKGTDSGD
jgi:hypothetical protein